MDLPAGRKRLWWKGGAETARLRDWDAEKGGTQIRTMAVDKVMEIALPFHKINAKPRDHFRFSVEILEGDAVLERHPQNGFFEFSVPTATFELENWQV
jgi:hypothetical protein